MGTGLINPLLAVLWTNVNARRWASGPGWRWGWRWSGCGILHQYASEAMRGDAVAQSVFSRRYGWITALSARWPGG